MTYRQADRIVKSLQRDINRRLDAVGRLEQKLSKAYQLRHKAWLDESPVAQKIQAQLSATSSTL
jgi:hypothetical protein